MQQQLEERTARAIALIGMELEQLSNYVGMDFIHDLQADIRHKIECKVSMLQVLHIGKRSAGWRPLLKAQYGKYETLAELQYWWNVNKNAWEIQDEYGRVLNWHELIQELLHHEMDNPNALSHHELKPNGVYRVDHHCEWTSRDFS